MEMLGNRRLGITQQQAWEALNDPETLKKCIPGCDKFELTGDNQYSVALALKIGPVSAKFNGKVQLSDIVAPDGYKLSFEGQGGVAGFAKGSSSVTLKPVAVDEAAVVAAAPVDAAVAHEAEAASPPPAAAGCELDYTVQAQVGGKIAQLGQRLIDGAAKSTADDFFKRFEAEMQSRYGPPPAPVVEAAEAPAEKTGVMSGFMKKIGLGKKDDDNNKDAPAAPGDASS
ncbi:carbon monoxide dehydrogenase subunit G [Variovorax paradoxus]|uniref:CoxG family protein n=1 Tax=Variovorax paradoxus TaxID=34073 RepID=UPI0021ABA912|nr:carbon monoxide dehydrogenase subunit G [Variovorax paradoxus]UVH55653.1 carbon monoxide dehydrogenase subunit G [Variovorax paradoxus]